MLIAVISIYQLIEILLDSISMISSQWWKLSKLSDTQMMRDWWDITTEPKLCSAFCLSSKPWNLNMIKRVSKTWSKGYIKMECLLMLKSWAKNLSTHKFAQYLFQLMDLLLKNKLVKLELKLVKDTPSQSL